MERPPRLEPALFTTGTCAPITPSPTPYRLSYGTGNIRAKQHCQIVLPVRSWNKLFARIFISGMFGCHETTPVPVHQGDCITGRTLEDQADSSALIRCFPSSSDTFLSVVQLQELSWLSGGVVTPWSRAGRAGYQRRYRPVPPSGSVAEDR